MVTSAGWSTFSSVQITRSGREKLTCKITVHDGLGDLFALGFEIALDDRGLCGKQGLLALIVFRQPFR